MKAPLRSVVFAVALLVVSRGSQAAVIEYTATLTGPGESPPNASPGFGEAEVFFDVAAHTMEVEVTFSGLLGTTTASHIHAATPSPGMGTAIVATQTPTFTDFPLGVKSGTYDHTFDTSVDAFYNPAFETANGGTAASAEAALFASLNAGTAYLNIHTTVVPGGEIRGFLTAVPEPSSLALGGIGLAGVAGYAARRRAAAAGSPDPARCRRAAVADPSTRKGRPPGRPFSRAGATFVPSRVTGPGPSSTSPGPRTSRAWPSPRGGGA